MNSETTDKNKLMTLAEAANKYGFTHDYLRELARRKRLKAHKLGRQWVTTAADVETFINSRNNRGVYREEINC